MPKRLLQLVCLLVLGSSLGGGDEAARPISRSLDRDLHGLIEQARAAGASEGAILEHRILRALQLDDLDTLPGLLEALEAHPPTVGEAHLFATERERDGFIAAVRARLLDRLKDEKGFVAAAETAVRLAENWARQLEIDERLEEVLLRRGGQSIPLDLTFENREGERVRLRDLVEGRKALLLDFWASWCGPCLRAMPTLKERAENWGAQGLAVVGINTDTRDQQKHMAAIYARYELDMPWIMEPPSDPLSGPLRIDSIPRVILLDPEGVVLFNGHPDDFVLLARLRELGLSP